MRLRAHISFGGRCREAFAFYRHCLGGTIETMLTWGESPMAKDIAPEWHGKICHATLVLGNDELAGVDEPVLNYEPPQSFQMLLELDRSDKAEQIFHALAENGTVTLPLQGTFWSPAYGLLTDQFGVRWEISCATSEQQQVSEVIQASL